MTVDVIIVVGAGLFIAIAVIIAWKLGLLGGSGTCDHCWHIRDMLTPMVPSNEDICCKCEEVKSI